MNKKSKQTKSEHEESDNEPSTGKECALCGYIPERIIYLSCDHIICLVCTTKLIISESEEKDIDFSEVHCGVCGESTQLSKEVQETLLEFLNSGEFQLNSENEDDDEEEEEDEEADERNESKNKNDSDDEKFKKNDEDDEEEDEEENEENNEEDDKEDEEQDEQNESKEDFAGNFGCQLHDGEEYAYYNPNTRTLYCTQCLLNSKLQHQDLSGFKPLKKCFPEILQGFQDMINEVEVCRNLLENKHKDFEIRKENSKSKCQSYIRKFEIAIEELIDYLQEQKNRMSQDLEKKLEDKLNAEEKGESSIETRVDYFNAIVDQISGFKQGDNPEEEIFGFFFANQEKIYAALQEEKEHKNQDNQPFKDFEISVKDEHDRAINKFYEQTVKKIQKINEQYVPYKTQHVPILLTEETKRNIEGNFSHFIQKIRQQSTSLNERPSSIDREKIMSKSKFNWNEQQTKDLTNNNFLNRTMDRSTVQKLEIEKKLKLLDFRSRKDEYIQSVNTVTNFRKPKDSISTKLELLKQQLKTKPAQPSLSLSFKFK